MYIRWLHPRRIGIEIRHLPSIKTPVIPLLSRTTILSTRAQQPLAKFSTSSKLPDSLPSPPPRPPHVDPYFLVYEGPLTKDLTHAKTVFLVCSSVVALLLGYAAEVQRVGIPFGVRRTIAEQFSIGGLVDGHMLLAFCGIIYGLIAGFFVFLLRRYVTRVYLFRGGSGRFMALREPLLPLDQKLRLEFGLEDVKGRSSIGPYLKDKAFVNSVIAGKPVYLDPKGFRYVGDEDAQTRQRVLKLAEILNEK